MRIIAGKYRGRRFQVEVDKGVRPTSERVREALFSALVSRGRVEGDIVFDPFCGTGAFGFEAISRGAKKVFLLDQNKKMLNQVDQIAKQLGEDAIYSFHGNSWKMKESLIFRLSKEFQNEKIDLLFCDPPYKNADKIEELILFYDQQNWLNEDVILVCEYDKLSEGLEIKGFEELKKFQYGDTFLSLFERS